MNDKDSDQRREAEALKRVLGMPPDYSRKGKPEASPKKRGRRQEAKIKDHDAGDSCPKNFGELWASWRKENWSAFLKVARNDQGRLLSPLPGGKRERDLAFSKLCEIERQLWEAGTALCRARDAIADIHFILPDDINQP